VRYFVIAAGALFGIMFVESVAGLIFLRHVSAGLPIYIIRIVLDLGMTLWALYLLIRRPPGRA